MFYFRLAVAALALCAAMAGIEHSASPDSYERKLATGAID